ncbi:MAG: hypothetical protein JWM68_2078 [Verrucomicrobiales bacterium]|nr:hypothetical protein [Verrucomicrobiales bacterium]
MNLFSSKLPIYHPQSVLKDYGKGDAFRIVDALCGVSYFGATGSGKTSSAKHLAIAYLAAGFGGLVLCAKKEERRQWEQWALETDRTKDLIIFEALGKHLFNFLGCEASRSGGGGGLSMNMVALVMAISSVITNSAGKSEGGGDSQFWEGSLEHLTTNLVDLMLLAGLPVSLLLMRSILNSAPQNIAQVNDPKWQENSVCAAILREADKNTSPGDEDKRADFEECRNYWLNEYPNLSEKTRSIITLTFSMLVRPFITRPLRRLFCTETTIQPESTFDGKIIIVDLPIQEYRLAGRVANIAWKQCFQAAVLRRMQPAQKDTYLRPVFLWADEAQNHVTKGDAEYQAVARSAGGCSIFLTQNRESYIRTLGDANTVDSLLGNLQTKFFCQNTGETNEWASKLLGERWLNITSTNASQGKHDHVHSTENTSHSTSVSRSDQKRFYVEPSVFTTLKRGGEINNFQVHAIVYKGGHLFAGPGTEKLPYKLLTFNQR